MAVSGHNGDNETLIGMSNSIGLTVYDESAKEIIITKTNSPIDIFIQRDSNQPEFLFYYINTSNINLLPTQFYLTNAFNVTSTNSSIHIELKPLNSSIGYVIVMKLGSIPLINSSYADYTSFKIFCPSKNLIRKIFFLNFSFS